MNPIKKIVFHLKSQSKFVIGFVILFYCVGVAGMLIPETFDLFKKLIPLALLLSFSLLFLFHTDFSQKTMMAFLLVYLSGFFVESAGVKTGEIFGSYYYGNSLGVKVLNTPLIIGINWLLLVYVSLSVTRQFKLNPAIQVVLTSLFMVGYDIIVEQMAPRLDMWYWAENQPPFKNYAAWFVLALIFSLVFKIFKLNTKNKLAPVILICQLLFFTILWINFNLLQ